MKVLEEGVTERLAGWVVKTKYNDIPKEAIRVAKERVLNMIGVILAGAKDPDSAGIKAVEVVREMGGNPISTIIGGGFKSNSVNAAFANGASAAALDVCDTTPEVDCHLSSCLLPSILAVAEETRASGKDVLQAYILSYEAAVRVGSCMSGAQYWKRGFHTCGTWACFGTTAASAKLMSLTVEELRSAWGIVASAAGGIRKAYETMTKPLHSAYSARSGVLAAKLAQKGLTGNKEILERDPDARPTAHMFFSFPVVFAGEEEVDLNKITEELGVRWSLVARPPTVKFHPGASATLIDLSLNMVKEHSIIPKEIERVDFYTSPVHMDVVRQYPYPEESDAARYNSWYQIAVALLDGEVGIKQHRLERLRRDDIRPMMERIHGHEIPGLHLEIYSTGDASNIYDDARMTIKLKDGREYSGVWGKSKGYFRQPLAKENLLHKYRTCASEALSVEDVEKSIKLLDRLEELPDLDELMRILIGKP